VAEDREVREKELQKVCRRKQRIFAKSRRVISIQVIGSGRTHGKGSTHHDSQFKKAESRGERTREVRTHDSITVIDRERTRTVDLVPKNSPIQKSGKEEEATHESPKVRGHEGSWPTVIVHGHIKEEPSIES
jgi:hypothetical protein